MSHLTDFEKGCKRARSEIALALYKRKVSQDLILNATGLSKDDIQKYQLLLIVFGRSSDRPQFYEINDSSEKCRGIKEAQKESAHVLLKANYPAEWITEVTLISIEELSHE